MNYSNGHVYIGGSMLDGIASVTFIRLRVYEVLIAELNIDGV